MPSIVIESTSVDPMDSDDEDKKTLAAKLLCKALGVSDDKAGKVLKAFKQLHDVCCECSGAGDDEDDEDMDPFADLGIGD